MLDADAGWIKGKFFRIPVHVYDRYAAFALIFSDCNNTIVNDMELRYPASSPAPTLLLWKTLLIMTSCPWFRSAISISALQPPPPYCHWLAMRALQSTHPSAGRGLARQPRKKTQEPRAYVDVGSPTLQGFSLM